MRKTILFALVAIGCLNSCNDKPADKPAGEVEKKTASMELLPMVVTEPIKAAFEAFSKKDVDGFTAGLAEDVRYFWSSGDSLIGKQAVKDYYSRRFALLDTITFTDHIFVPLQMYEPQSPNVPTGKWILHWANAHATYKNGKHINFWVHQVNHYNEAGMIDYQDQYLDRSQIAAATAGMK